MRLLRSRLLRVVVALGALALLSLAPGPIPPVGAQVHENDILSDSEIELVEQAGYGAYQQYRIIVTTRDGRTLLTTDQDGVKAEFEVSSNECLALWRTALTNGLETLVAASPTVALPDQSSFTIRYRVWQTARQFSVDGVDTLADDRYRTIVRAILALADKYSRLYGR